MSTEVENERPNIRIEIQNTAPEAMDIDENEKSEEEGEIRDSSYSRNSKDEQKESASTLNPIEVFKRNIESFNEFDPQKLQERARRFALKPEEIKTFTEADMTNLNLSLGVNADIIDQMRFEAIHLRSSNLINMENIMQYFMEYAPSSIEWVDEESCNIVWDDKLFTAKTLFHISQVVQGMPVRAAAEHVIDSFILEDAEESKDTSLSNENRQIELRDESMEDLNRVNTENSVNISTINIPIPPGFWRLGKKQIEGYSILMRFSLKIDKKPYKVEKCSRYYKSTSTKRNHEQQYKGIFSRNKEISKEVLDKNPWGILAKNWDEDLMFRERDNYSLAEPVENISPVPVPDNPELRVRLTAKKRLGNKEQYIEPVKQPNFIEEKTVEEVPRKEFKMPRMRMYADEEEEKIKRKKLLQTLKKQTEKLKKTEIPNSDLRNILRITNRKPKVVEQEEEMDLSYNLKNRSRKLVFTVAQESLQREKPSIDVSGRLRGHKVAHVEDKKPISPVRFNRDRSPEKTKSYKRESHRERERHRSLLKTRERRRSSDRKYGGRMYSSRGDSDDDYHIQKPKSKVALVIKTQKKPSVASTIKPRSRRFDTSSSSEEDSSSEESDSDSSEESSSSSSEDSDSDSSERSKSHTHFKRMTKIPLKVEIKNDQYKRKQ